jgi:hypothetical protein
MGTLIKKIVLIICLVYFISYGTNFIIEKTQSFNNPFANQISKVIHPITPSVIFGDISNLFKFISDKTK